MPELLEAEHVLIAPAQLVHLASLHVADNMIHRSEANRMEGGRAVAFRVERLEAGGEDAFVAVAVDEGVRRVAVGADRGALVNTEFVFESLRRQDRFGPAADGLVEAV